MAEPIETKIKDLVARHGAAMQRKAALRGQLEARKEELVNLAREITEAGYDPKKLPEEVAKAKATLEAAVANFETELAAVEKALAAFDKK